MTCPYRIAPEHGCAQAVSVSGDTLLSAVQRRELRGRSAACRGYICLHTLLDTVDKYTSILQLHKEPA